MLPRTLNHLSTLNDQNIKSIGHSAVITTCIVIFYAKIISDFEVKLSLVTQMWKRG